MSLSVLELASVVEALAPWRGAWLQGIHQSAPERLVLELYRPGHAMNLLLVARGPGCRVHPLARRPPNPMNALAFQMLCRKELSGALTGMEQVAGDRILTLSFSTREAQRRLIAELTGRHGNLFLTDERGLILGSALPNTSSRRALLPGQPWEPPLPYPDARATHRWPQLMGDALLEAIEGAYAGSEQRSSLEERRSRLLGALRTEQRKLTRLLENLERDAEKAAGAQLWRRQADLLQIHLHEIQRGQPSITVLDLFQDPAVEVEIPLDPAKSPTQHVQSLYHKAGRLGVALDDVLRRMEAAETRREMLVGLEERAREADEETLSALEAQSGIGAPQASPPPSRRTKHTGRSPWLTFTSREGFEIRVGRSARDNDTLTSRSRGNDFWLHVVGGPGAHVVVPCDNGPPGLTTLLDAAVLALKYSGRSEGDSGEVAYTRVKFVRKVPGIPGKVTYSQERCLHVRLDPDVLKALNPG